MLLLHEPPVRDPVDRGARDRLRWFLVGELELLPAGHPLAGGYERALEQLGGPPPPVPAPRL